MSQPPQPPQDPPPGSPSGNPPYGYPPQQPPGQPSYGYPQAPGQPPQSPPAPQAPPPGGGFGAPAPPPPGAYGATPPPSYGYPDQQPYGQQSYGQQPYGQQPYAQQHYGAYPPQAQFPGAGIPPQPGGGKQSTQRMMIIISTVVAVLLAIGAGVWITTSDDGKKDEAGSSSGGSSGGSGGDPGTTTGGGEQPKNADAKAILQVPYPSITADVMPVDGQWATAKTYAKSQIYSIVGYHADSGKQAWKIPLDGQICAASKHLTEDGKAAVTFQNKKIGKDGRYQRCTEMALIDLDAGKKLWQKTMPDSESTAGSGMGLTISDNVIAAAWIGGSVAYSVEGKELWKGSRSGSCQAAGYAGGNALVAVSGCPSPVSGPFKVQKLDPQTGKAQWSYDAPTGIRAVSVISSDPVVITISAGDIGETDVLSLDDKGKLRTKISLEKTDLGPKYNPNCSLEIESCKTAAVDKDTLYLPSQEHQGRGDYGRTNEIIAFDLATGEPRWKSEAGEKRSMLPLRMEGDTLIAYRQATYDSAGQIVGIEPKTGKQTVYLRLPNDTAEGENDMSPERNEALYAHGRFFLAFDTVSRSNTTHKHLVLGFSGS